MKKKLNVLMICALLAGALLTGCASTDDNSGEPTNENAGQLNEESSFEESGALEDVSPDEDENADLNETDDSAELSEDTSLGDSEDDSSEQEDSSENGADESETNS